MQAHIIFANENNMYMVNDEQTDRKYTEQSDCSTHE